MPCNSNFGQNFEFEIKFELELGIRNWLWFSEFRTTTHFELNFAITVRPTSNYIVHVYAAGLTLTAKIQV